MIGTTLLCLLSGRMEPFVFLEGVAGGIFAFPEEGLFAFSAEELLASPEEIDDCVDDCAVESSVAATAFGAVITAGLGGIGGGGRLERLMDGVGSTLAKSEGLDGIDGGGIGSDVCCAIVTDLTDPFSEAGWLAL